VLHDIISIAFELQGGACKIPPAAGGRATAPVYVPVSYPFLHILIVTALVSTSVAIRELRALLVLVFGTGAGAPVAASIMRFIPIPLAAAAAATPPHIIFTVDDWGHNDVGYNNNNPKIFSTPTDH
jgi:hypothetical protein